MVLLSLKLLSFFIFIITTATIISHIIIPQPLFFQMHSHRFINNCMIWVLWSSSALSLSRLLCYHYQNHCCYHCYHYEYLLCRIALAVSLSFSFSLLISLMALFILVGYCRRAFSAIPKETTIITTGNV